MENSKQRQEGIQKTPLPTGMYLSTVPWPSMRDHKSRLNAEGTPSHTELHSSMLLFHFFRKDHLRNTFSNPYSSLINSLSIAPKGSQSFNGCCP